MDEIRLKQGNEVFKDISKVKDILDATKNQQVAAILFCDENGINRLVSTDIEDIARIQHILTASHEARLKQLLDAFTKI